MVVVVSAGPNDNRKRKFPEFPNFREKGQQVVHIFDSVRGDPANKSVCLLTTGRWPPVPGHFCYPACCSNVQCVHGVLAAHLSKFQKRADSKENLSSKRDTASIESEMRWKDRYSSLLWFYEGIGTLGMISTDLFRFTLRAWLNSVRPFVTLNSGNPNDANSPKSLRIGLKSW